MDLEQMHDEFVQVLEEALQHLHDPAGLNRSGLADWLALERNRRSPLALQNLIADAIETLRPGTAIPRHTPAWRYYHILSQRYLEHLSQEEIARNLSISTRHVRRIHPQAVEALASQLESRYQIAHPPKGSAPGADDISTMSRQSELAFVSRTYSSEPAKIEAIFASVLAVVAPLAKERQIIIETKIAASLPLLAIGPTMVRHAMLTILSELLHCAVQGPLLLHAKALDAQVLIAIQARLQSSIPPNIRDSIAVVEDLMRISGGEFRVEAGSRAAPSIFQLVLPIVGQSPILVIDDNADALRLFERYLIGTRYRFVGTSDPTRAVELAEQVKPRAIILDLMLPGVDGWELLGRLRERPSLRPTPAIVCSILPQEALALALGAAGFLRKPVSRETFLDALDGQLLPPDRR